MPLEMKSFEVNGDVPLPTKAAIGIWNEATDGINIGWGLSNVVEHQNGGRIWQSAQPELTTKLLKPFSGLNIHLMNEVSPSTHFDSKKRDKSQKSAKKIPNDVGMVW